MRRAEARAARSISLDIAGDGGNERTQLRAVLLAGPNTWKPPWLKIWLVASTGFVSVYTWAFNSWGQPFLIMNLFHGVQYLALVWAMEGKRIAGLMRFGARPMIALGIYLGSVHCGSSAVAPRCEIQPIAERSARSRTPGDSTTFKAHFGVSPRELRATVIGG